MMAPVSDSLTGGASVTDSLLRASDPPSRSELVPLEIDTSESSASSGEKEPMVGTVVKIATMVMEDIANARLAWAHLTIEEMVQLVLCRHTNGKTDQITQIVLYVIEKAAPRESSLRQVQGFAITASITEILRKQNSFVCCGFYFAKPLPCSFL